MAILAVVLLALLGGCIPFGCVADGALVLTPDGDRLIEEIRIGDEIFSSRGVSRVVAAARHRVNRRLRLTLSGGVALEVTGTHPIACESGWRRAREIDVGDSVRTRNGWLSVTEITRLRGAITVHDLTVEPHHDFYAQSILVHNKSPARYPPYDGDLVGEWIGPERARGRNRLTLNDDATGTLTRITRPGIATHYDVTWSLDEFEITLHGRARHNQAFIAQKGRATDSQIRFGDDDYRRVDKSRGALRPIRSNEQKKARKE